ncbi:hypothetical protein Tco_0724837 [Tanacetum coccineum]|uniref:Uncharacterized protein n=1 Tax=Tanacetum coccineum TaxID=301880 RepID=A0ABQ4YCS3_9ASTR
MKILIRTKGIMMHETSEICYVGRLELTQDDWSWSLMLNMCTLGQDGLGDFEWSNNVMINHMDIGEGAIDKSCLLRRIEEIFLLVHGICDDIIIWITKYSMGRILKILIAKGRINVGGMSVSWEKTSFLAMQGNKTIVAISFTEEEYVAD